MPEDAMTVFVLAIVVICLVVIRFLLLIQSILRCLANHIKADMERHRYVTTQMDRMQAEIRLLVVRLEEDGRMVESPETSSHY